MILAMFDTYVWLAIAAMMVPLGCAQGELNFRMLVNQLIYRRIRVYIESDKKQRNRHDMQSLDGVYD